MVAYPVRPASGYLDATVEVPGSKSIANRALVCAALAEGTSALRNVPPGDDTVAMVRCLGALGVDLREVNDGEVVVTGTNPSRWTSAESHLVLMAGLAGTTSRFLTAVAALGDCPVTIDGEAPLRRRPMAPLHDALEQLGATVIGEMPGHLPVTVHGPLTGQRVNLPGDVSSQFVTALMLVAPLLPHGLVIHLTSPLISRPYVDLTADVMRTFGAPEVLVGDDEVTIGRGAYRAADMYVEPDASSASYPLAAAAIVGGRVSVPGLSNSSAQADAVFAELLRRMGAEVRQRPTGTEVRSGGQSLVGLGDLDLARASDLVPTVAVVAAFASGRTRIRGVGFIRGKESDRIGNLVGELRRLGIDAVEHEDGLEIHGQAGDPSAMTGALVQTHHDHRLAMALSLIGLRVDGVVVDDPDVVSKSWPGYWHVLESLTR